MKHVYLLQHSYQYGENDEHDETKTIGIFSSRLLAESIVEKYKDLPGFCLFDKECFYIDKYEVDFEWWSSGFIDPGEEDDSTGDSRK